MKKKVIRRELTNEEKTWAGRLMAIYLDRKRSEKLTQIKLGELTGMTQSGVGQYLNGEIALGLAAKVAFSMALKCSILDIDPGCPYSTPLNQDELALILAYRDMVKHGDSPQAALLIQAARLSPAYQRALEQETKALISPANSSTEKHK